MSTKTKGGPPFPGTRPSYVIGRPVLAGRDSPETPSFPLWQRGRKGVSLPV